jgi:predicted phosphate transport protein (TIGR00153 family)
MFFKKEKEVIAFITEHVDKVEECVIVATQAIKSYLEKDLAQAHHLAKRVDELEREADRLRHKILERLYYGAYLPLIREDIFNLVENVDDVANRSEKCCDFFLNQLPEIPDNLNHHFHTVLVESFSIIKPVKQSVICFIKGECPVEVAREYAQGINQIEASVDKLEWTLTKNIFQAAIDYSLKIHLKLCLDKIVAVSDRAKVAGKRLELVTLKTLA